MSRGFTLIELSIVLVIIGLVTAGILVGRDMIRAAELRSITTEEMRYATATNVFRDKFRAFPGDMRNATSIWAAAGGSGSDGTCQAAATTTTTCNGDGNGLFGNPNASGVTEIYTYWQHLGLAQLIPGTFTGQSGITIGREIPESRISGASWLLLSGSGAVAGTASNFAFPAGNVLYFWKVPSGSVLSPADALNVDTKTDDGMPGNGRIQATKGDGTATFCTTAAGVAPPGDAGARYDLTRSTAQCNLYFTRPF